MAVKPKPSNKRHIKVKPPVKPLSAKAKFGRVIDDLYNRLQADGKAFDAFSELSDHVNVSFRGDMQYVALCLMERCSTTLSTLQMNYDADCVSFMCNMQYEDKAQKPVNGWYRAPKIAVITSPSLALAVTLAYLQVCKQIGRFI